MEDRDPSSFLRLLLHGPGLEPAAASCKVVAELWYRPPTASNARAAAQSVRRRPPDSHFDFWPLSAGAAAALHSAVAPVSRSSTHLQFPSRSSFLPSVTFSSLTPSFLHFCQLR